MVDDLGSGALLDTALFGLDHEPTVQESLAAGVDLVAFSGDKLLGGPQAGILAGKRALIDVLKRHPLARAIRADKLGLAALTATLDHYRKGEALEKIPVWQMISRPLDDIHAQAQQWAAQTGGSVIDGESTVGGGSLPGATLPTALLALDVDQPDDCLTRLRQDSPPIIARIADNRVLFDPRTVLPGQESALVEGIRTRFSSPGTEST
jgi:L-seryl-tRNA(Ser) seleniumtransferase